MGGYDPQEKAAECGSTPEWGADSSTSCLQSSALPWKTLALVGAKGHGAA